MTDVERMLWHRLRFGQLEVAFRRQHPIVGYVVDFYAPSIRLAVELDGSQHAANAEQDAIRTRFFLSRGISVLRFWNNEVKENLDGVCEAVRSVTTWLAAQTSPLTPPLPGEGDASADLRALGLRLSLPETSA